MYYLPQIVVLATNIFFPNKFLDLSDKHKLMMDVFFCALDTVLHTSRFT